MAMNYSTYALSASQSPVSSYKRNNRQVTEGYDLSTAKYWFRLDFGAVREFSSRPEMEKALDAEFAPQPQPLTRHQQKALDDFLKSAEEYFKTFSLIANSRVSNYTRDGMCWQLRNAKLSTGQAATRFVTFCSMGI